jgi:hypothetical protein
MRYELCNMIIMHELFPASPVSVEHASPAIGHRTLSGNNLLAGHMLLGLLISLQGAEHA